MSSKAAAKSEKEWWKLASNVPCNPDSETDHLAQWKMFRNMDGNGNGYLSITEVDRYLKKMLGRDAEVLHHQIHEAFEDAMASHTERTDDDAIKKKALDNLVDFREFALFLADLKKYFYTKWLETIEKITDSANLTVGDFTRFTGKLTIWAVDVDPQATYVKLAGDGNSDKVIKAWKDSGGARLTWVVLKKWLVGVKKDFERVVVKQDGPKASKDNAVLRVGADGSIFSDERDVPAAALDPNASLNLDALAAKLPCDKYSKLDRELRNKVWNSFDREGDGVLTCRQLEEGLLTLLRTAKTDGWSVVDVIGPAITKAFTAARDSKEGSASATVTRGEEFRLLLVYLKRYLELLIAFDKMDASHDRQLEPGEFEGALHLLASWGVFVVDPAFEFSKIDTDGSGAVPFDEFCTWALSQGLDMHPLDAVTDEGGGDVSRPQKSSSEVAVTLRKERAARKAKEEKARIAAMTGHGDATHAWMEKHSLKEMLSKLPIKDTKADEAERIKMFSGADTNGNGFLSLFEVQQCLHSLLRASGSETVESFGPAITRAFDVAKGSDERTAGLSLIGGNAERVSRIEFRKLLVYLKRYFELLIAFDKIDLGDDRRLDYAEFEQALPQFAEWGMSVGEPAAEYKSMDLDGGGRILFSEFCTWALHKGLDIWGDGNKETNASVKLELADLATRDAELFGRGAARSRAGAAKDRLGRSRSPTKRKSLMEILDLHPETDLWSLIVQLPAGKTDADKVLRLELFQRLDVADEGLLTPQDIDDGLRAILASAGRQVSEPPPPAIDFAFQAVTAFKPPDEQYVSRADFRLFLCNLKWYTTTPQATGGRTPRLAATARPSSRLPPVQASAGGMSPRNVSPPRGSMTPRGGGQSPRDLRGSLTSRS